MKLFDTSSSPQDVLDELDLGGCSGVHGSRTQVDRLMSETRQLIEAKGVAYRTSLAIHHDQTELQYAYDPERYEGPEAKREVLRAYNARWQY